MTIALIAMYLWAGCTTSFAVWLFTEVGYALYSILPGLGATQDFSWAARVVVALLWPVVLPMWIWQEWRDRKQVAAK